MRSSPKRRRCPELRIKKAKSSRSALNNSSRLARSVSINPFRCDRIDPTLVVLSGCSTVTALITSNLPESHSERPSNRVRDPMFLPFIFLSSSPPAKARANPVPTPMRTPHTLQTGGPGTAGLSMQWPPIHILTIVRCRQTPANRQSHPHSIVVLRGSSGVKVLPTAGAGSDTMKTVAYAVMKSKYVVEQSPLA
jgi:hypothetical protein